MKTYCEAIAIIQGEKDGVLNWYSRGNLVEWMALKEIQEIKLSRLVEFWRKKETEESVTLLRFLEGCFDSWGLNSLRFGWNSEEEQDLGHRE